jgi:hypothetical protein
MTIGRGQKVRVADRPACRARSKACWSMLRSFWIKLIPLIKSCRQSGLVRRPK